MTVEDGDPHRGRRDPDGIVLHDLPGFIDHLHLFLGVAGWEGRNPRGAAR
jgi:hypothetical protein